MDELERRLSATEARLANAQGRLAQLEAEAVRSRRAREGIRDRELTALLDPGSLTQLVRSRGGEERLPALAQPLLARLRDDAGLGHLSAGRSDPVDASVNLLWDPLLEDFVGAALTNAFVLQGDHWSAKYTLNSGTVSTAQVFKEQSVRGDDTAYVYGFEHSVIVQLQATWGVAASDMSFYLRSDDPLFVAPEYDPSWLVASVRVVAGTLTGLAAATALLEIVDTGGNVVSEGDEIDLLDLEATLQHTQLEAAYQDPASSVEYRWRLRIDASKAAGAAAHIVIPIANPLLAFSDDGSVPMFTPAVALWVPR